MLAVCRGGMANRLLQKQAASSSNNLSELKSAHKLNVGRLIDGLNQDYWRDACSYAGLR